MTTSPRDERRERIRALPFDYLAQPTSAVECCNLCGGTVFTVLAHRDRYHYPAEAHACTSCGLVFLNPRMTAGAYGRFYAGTYRPLVSAYHGRLIDAKTIQAEQRDYAAERGDFIAPFVAGAGYETMLDIGGSTGVVAHAWATRFGLRGTVLDPAPLEVDEARRLGLETVTALVEEYDPGDATYDVVVICQTVDHLLDVGGTLRRVRALIRDGGLLFIDIVDLRAAYLRNWAVEEAIKIDHPYYLTEATMGAYLEQAGFAVRRADYAADHLHVGYVCRPSDPHPDARPSPASVDALLREIRYVQNAPRP